MKRERLGRTDHVRRLLGVAVLRHVAGRRGLREGERHAAGVGARDRPGARRVHAAARHQEVGAVGDARRQVVQRGEVLDGGRRDGARVAADRPGGRVVRARGRAVRRPRHQDGRKHCNGRLSHHQFEKITPIITWCLDSLVVVRVDAHLVPLQLEGVLAVLESVQLVVGLQVWPPPQAAVDHMGQALALGHLQSTVQRPASGDGQHPVKHCLSSVGLPGDGDALGARALRGDRLFEFVQAPTLLELLHQALDGLLTPLFLTLTLINERTE